jgi:DNA-binding SARP family transcriptional activator/ABC-type transport system substrate-binding protein
VGSVEFRVLGPVEVRVHGDALALGGRKQRALLALLLLHANEVVSRDRLIDALWGERPPPSVHQSLDSYVSRLRRVLGHERLLRRPPGYTLALEPGELDLARFEELLEAGREAAARGDPSEAASTLRIALALWRGPALADVLYEPFAVAEAERLEERRLVALEERIDADLAAARGAELVAELDALVREHPLRERLLGQLMLALYRAGRHGDALRVLQSARRRLATELGLEPGPQLRELERLILRHDPALAPLRRLPRATTRLRRRGVLAAAAAIVLGSAAAATILALGSSTPRRPLDVGVSRLAAVAMRTGEVTSTTALARAPAALASGMGSLWVADASGATVSRIDPETGNVVDRIHVAGEPGSIVAGGGAIWVASTVGGTISRIDPDTDTVTQSVGLGGASAAAVAFGGGSLWVADPTDQTLIELEPRMGSVRRTWTLDLRPTTLAVGDGVVWVGDYTANLVEQIAAGSGETLSTTHVGNGPAALASVADGVWVANALDGTVSRIDSRTAAITATLPVGGSPTALVAAGRSVWAALQYSGTVVRIDSRRRRVTAAIHVGGAPASLAADGRRVWTAGGPGPGGHRGGTLRLVATETFDTIDPAFDLTTPLVFTRLAYDTLVSFEQAPGPAGLRLVPDLAIAIPDPTRAGTTYAFRLRPGIRYSDGRLLKAQDFRRAIERLFRVRSPGTTYYTGIAGAAACVRRPRTCDLSRGIETDDAAGTVVFHLRAPDPDFLFKLTVIGFSVPVPAGTPNRALRSTPLPGTGPYTIVRASERSLRFARNRFFREWSHAAQPDANPDAIEWRIVSSLDEAVDSVERGAADWMLGLIPPSKLRGLQLSRPGQLHINTPFTVEFALLNSHRAPFDDVRVRRALNYAIDRATIARFYGGPSVATPLCQPLAPGMPGFRRYCPYTVHPRSDGAWSAPDLARARRLIAASGTRGTRVDVWGTTDSIAVPRELPAYVARVLRSLGYRVRLHLVSSPRLSTLARRIQLAVVGDWQADYPAPSSYLPGFFGCRGGYGSGYVCDPALDRAMLRATALQLRHPDGAAALWARVDHAVADRAYWVPTVSLRAPQVVSTRVRNYQYSPVWGFIASQVWLR